MKKILAVATALMMLTGAGNAVAGFSYADNNQEQEQNIGGGVVAGPAGSAFIGGYGGTQEQSGFGVVGAGDLRVQFRPFRVYLSPGSEMASDEQQQMQSVGDGASDSYNGNFANTGGDAYQWQNGDGIAEIDNGIGLAEYSYFNSQQQLGGAAGVSVGGQVGVAGSAYLGQTTSFAQESHPNLVDGDSNRVAEVSSGQGVYQEYNIQSVGPNGYIYQSGSQEVDMGTQVTSSYNGPKDVTVQVAQGGGTVAMNNGQGTYMEGAGTAIAVGNVSENGGNGGFDATQTHSYSQEVSTGNAYQNQSGSVTTSISSGQLN